MKRLLLLLTALGGAILLPAGTITGVVKASGAPTPGDAAGAGNYQSRRYKFAEKVDYETLTDFVVYIDAPMTDVTPPGSSPPVAITTQKNAVFEPHVLAIAAGTTVKWPNEDDIYHNVFSMSETKEFNLGLYHREKTPLITFEKPGRVDVFCAIHSQMYCIILVVPNHHFAKVDVNRTFTIKNVPPGTYKLRAWHERLPSQAKEIVVPAEGEVRVDFNLGLSALPQY